jgi:putative FmdB family regulatory protein
MPIYEYQCEKCGAHLEVLQRIGDKPLTRCTKCKGRVEKVVSRSSFQLKGAGWYVTDYAGKKSSESKSDAKAEPKSDAKSDAKTGSAAPAAAE